MSLNSKNAINKMTWRNHKQGQTGVYIGAWNGQQFMLEKQFQV